MDCTFIPSSFVGRATLLRRKAFPCSPRISRPCSVQIASRPHWCVVLNSAGNAETATVPSFSDKSSAILLVDHGSKRAAANDMLYEMRELVIARLGRHTIVHVAHMELAEPTIMDGFSKCVADGVSHIAVVPFFLAPGRHSTSDIPAMVKEAAEAFPGCTYEVREHLGTHPGLVDAVVDRATNVKV